MENNNIEQLKKLAKVFNTANVITSEDIEEVLKGVLTIMSSFKKDNQTLNAETKRITESLLNNVIEEHEKIKDDVTRETQSTKEEIESKLAETIKEIKSLMEEVKAMKPLDGKDAIVDEDKIVEEVLTKIKLPEQKEIILDDAETIADKLETLKGDKRLDASAIKNLPKAKSGGGGVHNIYQMGDVVLTNLAEADVLTWDDTNKRWKNAVASGGGTIDGSGTTNELAYWVDSDTLGTLAVATYPSLTELSYVKGLNSSAQTQINTKAPSTSPTFATSITGSYLTASEILITDGSKNIVSAAVATYPSLTELTYLKGVTSAIQTQLNAKQASDTQLTDLAGLSYAGNASKYVRVKATEDGFELATVAGGTIDGSGTTNELTYWVDSDTLGALAVATYPSLTELSYVKGVTSAIQTQLNAKATTLSGTINEIAYFDSSSTIASLAVATYPSLTELSYVKGVTSAIQTQLGTKAPSTAPTFATSITGSYLTASELLITDGSKNIVSAAVATYPSLTELTYLKGVTSGIQAQIDGLSGFAYGASVSGTTADGLTITLSNSSNNAAGALKLIAGNTQANRPVLANLQIGTSANAMGLMIKGTGSTTVGDVGTGENHLTLWANIDSSVVNVLSIANGSTFTERLKITADGAIAQTFGTSTAASFTNTSTQTTSNLGQSIIKLTHTPGDDTNGSWGNGAFSFTQTNGRDPGVAFQTVVTNAGTLPAVTAGTQYLMYAKLSRRLNSASTINDTAAGIAYFTRTNYAWNAGANYTVSSPVVKIEQVSSAISGTLAVSGDLLQLVAEDDASFTGKIINAFNDTTSVFAVDKTGAIELGHATDTTLSRVSAGVVAIEGNNILVNGGALGTPSSATLTNATGLPTAGLVDDAVTLAKMASGTAGNLITYDASGNPAAVATGTSGQVLTSNGAGAAPTFQDAGGGASTTIWITKPVAGEANTTIATRQIVTNTTQSLGMVYFPFAMTVTSIVIEVATVGTNGTLDLTLYSKDGQTRLISVTTATISASGIVSTAVANVSVPAGVYYIGMNPNSTADITVRAYSCSTVDLFNVVPSAAVMVGTLTITGDTPATTFDPTALTSTGTYGIFRVVGS